MKILPLLVAGALAAVVMSPAAASAGATFTATTKVESATRRLAGLADSTVRGWVDGNRGKVEFVESSNPATPKGDVLLTTDGGRTTRYFDLGRKECRRWAGLAPREVRVGPGSAVSTSFRNVRVEKALDEPGPVLKGLPTRHWRIESEYDTLIEGQQTSHRSHTTTIDDLWVAETLPDPGFSVWLTKGSPGAAGGELGAKLDAVLASVSGTPVKRVSATSVAFDGGKPVATTTTVEVIRLRREKIPASTFAPLLDCTNRTGQER